MIKFVFQLLISSSLKLQGWEGCSEILSPYPSCAVYFRYRSKPLLCSLSPHLYKTHPSKQHIRQNSFKFCDYDTPNLTDENTGFSSVHFENIFRSGLTLFNSNDGIAIKINIKKSLRRYTKLYKLYKKLVAPNETKKGKRT